MIKVCIIGLGRTGKEIAALLLKQEDIKLVMTVCSENSNKLGKDLGEILNINNTGIKVTSCSNLEQDILKYKPQVAIDFSTPEASILNSEILAKMKVKTVIGTTGFTEIQTKKLIHITKTYKTGIVHAPNITMGVNVMMLLTHLAANILENYDCDIIESHFKEKKDLPSGTAKKIAAEVIKGTSRDPFISSNEIDYSDINIHSIRSGGIIGQHKVILAGPYDKIEITHESFARTAFALGAIRAVKYIFDKIGFYEMNDVLNFEDALTGYIAKQNHIRNLKYDEKSINI
jgi:4-hydroxy-tetrahydrodipicolinate reductase